MSEVGVKNIANALKKNKTLGQLMLWGILYILVNYSFCRVWEYSDPVNNLENEIGEKGAESIAEAVKENKFLTSLGIRGKFEIWEREKRIVKNDIEWRTE